MHSVQFFGLNVKQAFGADSVVVFALVQYIGIQVQVLVCLATGP
jgi:hypothetical protein